MAEGETNGKIWRVKKGALVLPEGAAPHPATGTIPLAAITATRIRRRIKWPTDAIILIIVGVLNNVFALLVTGFGIITLGLGFALIAIGLFIGLRAKPVYQLLITTGGAPIVALRNADKAVLDTALAALDRLRQRPGTR